MKWLFALMAGAILGSIALLAAQQRDISSQAQSIQRDLSGEIQGIKSSIADEFRSQHVDRAAQISALENATAATRRQALQIVVLPVQSLTPVPGHGDR